MLEQNILAAFCSYSISPVSASAINKAPTRPYWLARASEERIYLFSRSATLAAAVTCGASGAGALFFFCASACGAL